MPRIIEGTIDVNAAKMGLRDLKAGALVDFEGWVRDHHEGYQVLSLHYDCHKPMAEKELAKILDEAMTMFDVQKVEAQHRVGPTELGDLVVWVGASAAHRQAAFEACRYVIERIKSELPIWKREVYEGGAVHWQHELLGK
jgi:molybdopterin synthase catalytic subunit